MDDFLGTSIQYSEQQLLALEREHDFQMEQTAQQLIESGFLDSDYEGSSGYYDSDSDIGDDLNDDDLCDEYVIFEELSDDDQSIDHCSFNERVFDSLKDDNSQIYIYEQIIIGIDYAFYGIDEPLCLHYQTSAF
eukprot:429266_1